MAEAARTDTHLFVVTFYSYKGGVGRSVALLNTAYQLASRGRKVALLDFDLEAPGLHSAVASAWLDGDLESPVLRRRGVLDYFHEYRRREGEIPPLDDYLSNGFGPSQLIHLVGAGDPADFERYTNDLARMDFEVFARDEFGRELMLELREELQGRGFDYLLIDSRTGHTDFTGATTILLPHLVVLFTNLSHQSLEGTAGTRSWIIRNARGKRRPEADEVLLVREPDDPQVETLVVASPVPFGDQGRIAEAQAVLEAPIDHVIYYVPRIAANETEHVIVPPEQRRKDDRQRRGNGKHALSLPQIDPAYDMFSRLADRVQSLNPYDPGTLVELGFETLSRQDWRVALSYFEAADHFLGSKETPADLELRARLLLGESRALSLGFQTGKAREVIEDQAGPLVEEGQPALKLERVVALLQLVRGQLGSDELEKAVDTSYLAWDGAKELARRGEPDKWVLVAGLAAAEALYNAGRNADAAKLANSLPEMARRLNRRIERIRALQVLAEASLMEGRFAYARNALNEAAKDGGDLGVAYITAGTGLAFGLLDLAQGSLTTAGCDRLVDALGTYDSEGDAFGAANCYSELALYYHRRGEPLDVVQGSLKEALERYRGISGTTLGQANVLLYATRALADHGLVHPTEGLNATAVESTLDRATDTLLLAELLVSNRGFRTLHTTLEAYLTEIQLYVAPDTLARARRELGLSSLEDSPPDEDRTPLAGALDIEARRCHLLAALVSPARPAGASPAASLATLADNAALLGARYEEACTRALVALAHEHADEGTGVERELARVEAICRAGPSWTVWGQVRCVAAHLDEGRYEASWKDAAARVLQRAGDLGMAVPPATAGVGATASQA